MVPELYSYCMVRSIYLTVAVWWGLSPSIAEKQQMIIFSKWAHCTLALWWCHGTLQQFCADTNDHIKTYKSRLIPLLWRPCKWFYAPLMTMSLYIKWKNENWRPGSLTFFIGQCPFRPLLAVVGQYLPLCSPIQYVVNIFECVIMVNLSEVWWIIVKVFWGSWPSCEFFWKSLKAYLTSLKFMFNL